MEEKSSIFESVKNSVVGTIRGTGDVAKAVVDPVSGTLAHNKNSSNLRVTRSHADYFHHSRSAKLCCRSHHYEESRSRSLVPDH